MALLEGGSTIAGYPIMHTGMPEIYMMGNINFTASKRMKFGPNTAYGGTLIVGGDSPIANTTTANVFTSNGNLHLDAGTGHGVYINWNSGNPGATTVPTFVVGNGQSGTVLAITKEGNLTMDAGTVVTPNNKSVGIQNAAGTHWMYPQDSSGNMNIRATSGVIVMDAAQTIHRTESSVNIATIANSGILLHQGWFRTKGQQGLYFEDYGGGWYMADSIWIRTYNGKNLYAGYGTIATDGAVSAGTSGPIGRLTSLVGTNGMPRPGVDTNNLAAYIENNNDGAGHHGMIVATRWGGVNSTIFEAATYWGDSSQTYLPLLGVYGDKSVRINRKLVIPVGNDMYAT